MMEEPVVVNKGDEPLDLPPGFRFHPTDEEIITCYLTEKVLDRAFSATAIGEADLNKCEPWDLPKKAKMGEKDWYFFCQKDRKYPTGLRTNRATQSGYWKATGKDKEIFKGKNNLVGMKKTLVFYRGRAPKGEKTNWVMHEFRLEGKFACYNLPKAAKMKMMMTMKPEEHRICETPLTNVNYASTSQGNLNSINNPMGIGTSNHNPLQNTTSPFNMFQDYYMHQGNNSFQQCKREQFSNTVVSASQDTCLSNDRNTDTSSVVSKQDNMGRNKALYEDLDQAPSSVATLSDLDCLWDDY
ncbi:hypothetical protein LR48_Vigan10g176300 [Vigna angularis]|uniref:NAC domain-containing protein n=1 Tax=Phaseolus angularis TaxID=3914 RepID=A0A0L9VLC8_PHAAN|nr:hypothetical protein LR48_Vigan10g176300 [Vigna angularis]